MGKTVAELRTLNDAAEYEFGSDRQDQIDAAYVILRAAFAKAAMFWNELAFLDRMDDEDFLREPRLIEMRHTLAAELNRIGRTLHQEDTQAPALVSSFVHSHVPEQSRYGEYVCNTDNRFREFVSIISRLNLPSRAVEVYAPSIS